MIPVPVGVKVWLATDHTDMRKGFPGLSLMVQEALKRDPMCGHLFVFRGRGGGLIKVIWHDGQGACLFTKKLERGRFDELKGHDCIAFNGVLSTRLWTFRDGAKDIAVPIRTRLSVNTAEAAVDAAAAGLGITRVMAYQAKRAVDAGLLVPLLEDFEPMASPVHLLHISEGLMPLKLRTFLDFATPRLRDLLK